MQLFFREQAYKAKKSKGNSSSLKADLLVNGHFHCLLTPTPGESRLLLLLILSSPLLCLIITKVQPFAVDDPQV
jgi:hypothetical protein